MATNIPFHVSSGVVQPCATVVEQRPLVEIHCETIHLPACSIILCRGGFLHLKGFSNDWRWVFSSQQPMRAESQEDAGFPALPRLVCSRARSREKFCLAGLRFITAFMGRPPTQLIIGRTVIPEGASDPTLVDSGVLRVSMNR